ncbi:MAG: hypothetical protein AAF846_02895 [Chloroflexota bacterium]
MNYKILTGFVLIFASLFLPAQVSAQEWYDTATFSCDAGPGDGFASVKIMGYADLRMRNVHEGAGPYIRYIDSISNERWVAQGPQVGVTVSDISVNAEKTGFNSAKMTVTYTESWRIGVGDFGLIEYRSRSVTRTCYQNNF